MTVNELMANLARLDGALELVCFCSDEGTRQRSTPFRVYIVERVHVTRAERVRAGSASCIEVNFGPRARDMAVVHITTDF
jgi:hypothetical protein